MTALLSRLATCQRPKLLISAARIGSLDYARKPALERLLGLSAATSPEHALRALMAIEAEHDALRRAQDATYSVARHVELLACVMGEARLLRETQGDQRPAAIPAATDTASDAAPSPEAAPARTLALV